MVSNKLMRYFIFTLILFFTVPSFAQQNTVDVYSLQQLQERVRQENDTLYVVNFWATWCSPCVRELPYFMQLSNELASKPIKFILMSLDAKDNLAQTNNFITKKKIKIETHLFSAGDPNEWINALEPSWQGSIPATFLYHKGSKISFKESSFSNKKDLESFINNRR